MGSKSLTVQGSKADKPEGKRTKKPNPFAVKDCSLLSIATGRRAQNLRELRVHLQDAHRGCIYYHFWGNRLHPRFEISEFQNDFAAWARYGLYDHPLSERLGIIDPTAFADLEELRREVIDVIEERLAETEMVPWAKADQQFYFIRSQIVVFDTHILVKEPREFYDLLGNMSVGSIFYHFIDARRRLPESVDDFSSWLRSFGQQYIDLQDRLAAVDPYFCTLTELRGKLLVTIEEYFGMQSHAG